MLHNPTLLPGLRKLHGVVAAVLLLLEWYAHGFGVVVDGAQALGAGSHVGDAGTWEGGYGVQAASVMLLASVVVGARREHLVDEVVSKQRAIKCLEVDSSTNVHRVQLV